MAKTNDVDVSLFSDDDFLALSASARWLYVWTFTNPRCNMAGLYKASVRIASMETGLAEHEVQSAITELEDARFVVYDPDGRWLWVRTRVKHIRSQNRNVAAAIVSAIRDLPRGHPFGPAFCQEYSGSDWGRGDHRGVLDALLSEAAEDRDDWFADGPPTVPQPLLNRSLSVSKRSGAGAEVKGFNGNGNHNGPSRTRARARAKPVDPDALPPDFPEQLVPVLDTVVVPCLSRVAEAKGALVVTRAAVARVMANFPRKPHDTAAPEFEHFWIHGPGQATKRQDIVATYRKRLDQVPDRAGPPASKSSGSFYDDDWVARYNATAPGRKVG